MRYNTLNIKIYRRGYKIMKSAKKILVFVMIAVLTLSLASCGKQASVETAKANGYITLATNAEFEPFEYKDGNDFEGIDIEIAKKIAEKLDVELKIHDIAFDSLIAELKAGKADFVAAGMTADDDRRKNADFSDSYFNASQAIVVMKDSDIKSREDLNGKKVGVQSGTTGDKYCTNEDGSSDVKDISVQRYSKGVDAVQDLISGRVDAVVIDDFPATKFVEKNSDKIQKLSDALTVEEYAIAVQKGNSEMVKVINEVLAEMKNSGELDQIIDKYKAALGE